MLITQSVNILKFSRLFRLLRHKRNVIESKPKNIRITSNHTGQLGTCFISKDIILTEQKTKQNGMLKYWPYINNCANITTYFHGLPPPKLLDSPMQTMYSNFKYRKMPLMHGQIKLEPIELIWVFWPWTLMINDLKLHIFSLDLDLGGYFLIYWDRRIFWWFFFLS